MIFTLSCRNLQHKSPSASSLNVVFYCTYAFSITAVERLSRCGLTWRAARCLQWGPRRTSRCAGPGTEAAVTIQPGPSYVVVGPTTSTNSTAPQKDAILLTAQQPTNKQPMLPPSSNKAPFSHITPHRPPLDSEPVLVYIITTQEASLLNKPPTPHLFSLQHRIDFGLSSDSAAPSNARRPQLSSSCKDFV